VTRVLEEARPDKYVLEVVPLMVALVGGELPTLMLTNKTAKAESRSHTTMEKKPDMKDQVEAAALELVVLVALEEESSGFQLQDPST